MKLHNTLSGQLDHLKPLEDGRVKLYTCGLTVYSQPHIGNWLGYVYWDVLVRALEAEGYIVERTQNITDVGHLTDDADAGEDKMLKAALKEGRTAWEVAEHYINVADHEAYELLRLKRPTHLARATDYIEQQIEFTKTLEEKGYTYVIDDGVYFDTSKLMDYGTLARLDIKGLRFGARVADTGKKHPTDFAVWKFSNPSEKRDMEWDSPWGKGFPGWHLECSVIARQTLGDQIDIHTGGIDHIPVHHTNEIAQTEAVTGTQFAHTWLHNNHIKINGTKISKSLGNIITLEDINQRGYDMDAFKLSVLAKHYRTEGNFSWDILDASANRLAHWRDLAVLRHQTHDSLVDDDEKNDDDSHMSLLAVPGLLRERLSDDLDTPGALAVIDEAFTKIASTARSKIHRYGLVQLLESIDELLGIDILSSTPDISDESKQLLSQRQRARDDRDWERSDELRDTLLARGIAVRDTTSGQTWSYAST